MRVTLRYLNVKKLDISWDLKNPDKGKHRQRERCPVFNRTPICIHNLFTPQIRIP